MDRLVVSLFAVALTTPAFAASHCAAPEAPFPNYDVIRSLQEGKSYTQAHDLTYRLALVGRNNRVADMCEADPINFSYNCDAEPFPTVDVVNPDFLNLSNTDFSRLLDENRASGAIALQRLEDCVLKGSGNSDG